MSKQAQGLDNVVEKFQSKRKSLYRPVYPHRLRKPLITQERAACQRSPDTFIPDCGAAGALPQTRPSHTSLRIWLCVRNGPCKCLIRLKKGSFVGEANSSDS
jgi:hypothetical protein